jgi:FKBP-type peptidyl-prolyl cis-trans isomerase
MREFSIVIAASLLCIILASGVHSQTAPPQQPGAAPRPAAGAAPPTAPPGAIPTPPAPAVNATVDQKQVSYALGRQFAMNLKNNEIPYDLESLFAGIRDVVTGAQPKYTDEQLGATMKLFMQEMEQKVKARMQQQAAQNKKMEADFLAKNKTQPGVQTTASGLQYKVIQPGKGASPTLGDMVRCNYRGVLLDGTEFDNSQLHGGPAEFRVGRVIPGWNEALQKMKVGDKWQLYVPAALAYDMDPPPDAPMIEPGSMLIFEVELLGIGGQQSE